ncbi:hypothetical protein StoSoilB5_30700 [Arthrobacter sp. StoSoilB5]|nr:hypothetical protein StoSoilB5_30700 [Arthrobacter sp. StoSoilB5]
MALGTPADTKAARTDSVSGLGLAAAILFSAASTAVLVAATAGSILVPPAGWDAGLEEGPPAAGAWGDDAVHADSASVVTTTRKAAAAFPFS